MLAVLGDSVTTDHISPAGSIQPDSPAGKYLIEKGVSPKDFNSYGARRGNHEVMMRGTFANIRLRNQMAPGTEGGWTVHLPDKTQTTIYDAAMQYQKEGVPLMIIAGKEYGSGSSRDWAAKGPRLLGVQAVIAESFERIHRSNLVGMGVLPLQFKDGENAESLGLNWLRSIRHRRHRGWHQARDDCEYSRQGRSEKTKRFQAVVRIDTPYEIQYYQHGGILAVRAAPTHRVTPDLSVKVTPTVLQADIAIRHVVAGFSPRSFSLTERSFVGNRARAEAHDYVPDAKLG